MLCGMTMGTVMCVVVSIYGCMGTVCVQCWYVQCKCIHVGQPVVHVVPTDAPGSESCDYFMSLCIYVHAVHIEWALNGTTHYSTCACVE